MIAFYRRILNTTENRRSVSCVFLKNVLKKKISRFYGTVYKNVRKMVPPLRLTRFQALDYFYFVFLFFSTNNKYYCTCDKKHTTTATVKGRRNIVGGTVVGERRRRRPLVYPPGSVFCIRSCSRYRYATIAKSRPFPPAKCKLKIYIQLFTLVGRRIVG